MWKNETGYLKMWKNRNQIFGTTVSAAPGPSLVTDTAGGGRASGASGDDGGSRRRSSVGGAGGDGEGDVGDHSSGVTNRRDGLISLERLSATLKQLDLVNERCIFFGAPLV